MPNSKSPSDHAPLGLVFSANRKVFFFASFFWTLSFGIQFCSNVVAVAAEVLSDERKAMVDAAWNEIPKPENVKSKGKPDNAQLEKLKAFAEAKKKFVNSFEGLEQEYAKQLSRK